MRFVVAPQPSEEKSDLKKFCIKTEQI